MNAQLLLLTEPDVGVPSFVPVLAKVLTFGFVLVFVLIVVSFVRKARKRGWPLLRVISKLFDPAADLSFLRSQGWEYAPRAELQWQGRFALYPLATPTEFPVRELVWADVEGLRCTAFNAVSGYFPRESIELVDLPVVLPPLTIYPPLFDDEGAQRDWFPGRPFLSESADFNARWRVRGGDSRYVSAVLSPRVMEWLLRDDLTDMVICVDGAAIAISYPGPLTAESILPRMAILRDLARRIPQHVFNDFGTPRPDLNGGRWGGPRRVWASGQLFGKPFVWYAPESRGGR